MPQWIRDLIADRGPQLLARYVGQLIFWVAGVLQIRVVDEQIQITAGVVAALAIGGALMAFDHFWHGNKFESKRVKERSLKRTYPLLLLVLAPAAFFALNGCKAGHVSITPEYDAETGTIGGAIEFGWGKAIAEIEANGLDKSATANRAVCIGVNDYPGNDMDLAGCVNDAKDVAYYLSGHGFKTSEIRLCTDSNATTENMRGLIAWALSDAKPGDLRVISYSGHGAQYAGTGSEDEPDRVNEVLCPYDFDWTPGRMIQDKELFELFKAVPAGVSVWFLSDSCHSGDLIKRQKNARIKSLTPPEAVRANIRKARQNTARALIGETLDIGYGSGCKSSELSLDWSVNGRPCGAFTHYLLKTLKAAESEPERSFKSIVAGTVQRMRNDGITSQTPQSEGLRRDKAFLK